MNKIKYVYLVVAIIGISLYSCTEGSLDPTLDSVKYYPEGIKTVDDLHVLLKGAYNRITATSYYGRDYIIYGEIRSDNCFANGRSGRFITPASFGMGPNDGYATDTWYQIYRVIASANTVIDNSSKTLEGDDDLKKQIVGQAYAIRALAHFDLLRLYGQHYVTGGNDLGIPYVKTYKGEGVNYFPTRNTVSEVKQFIYEDIAAAESLMSEQLNDDSKEYLTTYAVQALKARVAIYFGDWLTAKTACESIISSNKFSIVPKDNFIEFWTKDGGVNSIFELAFSSTDNNNINGLQYIYRGTSYGDIRALNDLYYAFEVNDVRRDPSMFAYAPWKGAQMQLTNLGKYPSSDYSDNIPIFRYEEVILNYAEALFELGQVGLNGLTALDYLNLIPQNRNATSYGSINKDNILLERRKEFAFEGFRFHDLVRTGRDIPKVDLNQRFTQTIPYGDYRLAFPIPQAELNSNANMVQNNGY